MKIAPVFNLWLCLTAAAAAATAGGSLNVTDFGAVGDGIALNTSAIQNAIDACNRQGGGTVRFPAGSYLTGTIQIKSNVTLKLEKNATLAGSTDAADYRNLDPFIVIEGVTIRSRDLGMPNNDGIDLDSCENVRVRNCDIISGDDALCIKATSATKPSRDIIASGCKLSSRCNAIKLGTESIGGFENINVSNCQITNTKMAGIALYEVDGASLRNVTVSDITMDGVTVPISVRLGARLMVFRQGEQPRPNPGELRDVMIKNVSAKNIGMIGVLINGIPGHPVESLSLENIDLDLPGGVQSGVPIELPEKETSYPEFSMFGKMLPASGAYVRHARAVVFKNVRATLKQPDTRPPSVFIDVEGAKPEDFAIATQPK